MGKKPTLMELISKAPWREAVTYRDTWPHEYVLLQKDSQRELFATMLPRFKDGEGVPGRFFNSRPTYLFLGGFKYWFDPPLEDLDGDEEGEYVLTAPASFMTAVTSSSSPEIPGSLRSILQSRR